jgi:S-formylglutathione hydrolase FrmB
VRARLLTAAFLLAATVARAEIRHASFASAALGRDVAVAVQLPPSYGAGDRRYPVLYVLHGLFESQAFWEGRGLATILEGLWTTGQVPELIVVAVDGGNSFFVNGHTGRYEDLVTQDAIAYAESAYRVVPGRRGRGLLGVSMGGYAALRIALSHPDVFGAVAAHSAMLLEEAPTAALGARGWQMDSFHRVFGDPIDPALWSASDPLLLAQKADAKSAPALYFDCGGQDRYGLFEGNEDLHRRLSARGVTHEFAILPGDHGYEYVRSVLERSLRFVGKVLAGGG